MLSGVLRTAAQHGLFAAGDRVLVGLSGGPDSTALLHALLALAKRWPISVQAACVDHGLRPDSAEEARQVAARAEAAGVPCAVLRVEVQRRAHVSIQDAARRARLSALTTHAQTHGCVRIALGHTADDQAETVLFRIVRGTGVAGLAGIPYQRGPFVRPLLDTRRADVIAFLRRRRVAYVEDASNLDPRHTRVRIRHRWLPFLAAENPRIVEALLGLADDARRQATPPDPVSALGLRGRAATRARRLAADGRGTRLLSVPGGQLEVRYGEISARTPEPPAPVTITVEAPGVYAWSPERELVIESVADGSALPDEAAVFDAAVVKPPFWVRSRWPGDRMRPRGGLGTRKLQDLLVDAKVPRADRAGLPVVTAVDGTLLYVPGLRPAELGRPGPQTRAWVAMWVRPARTFRAETSLEFPSLR